jgi:hypothetical protein
MDAKRAVAYTVHHCSDSSNCSETLGLTPLSDGLYRVEDSSVLDESIRYGDVISATPVGELELRFLEVTQKSSFRTACCAISKKYAESPDLPILLEKVQDAGGVWERIFGGLLLVHLPQDSSLDVQHEFDGWHERNR